MPETHDIGPLFVHQVELERGTPIVHRAPTNEIEEPFRHSNSVVVRLFGRKGWVFGWWKHDPDRTEDEALLAALRLGAHGGYTNDEDWTLRHAQPITGPEAEGEDRPEVEVVGGGVGHAGDAGVVVRKWTL